MLVDGYSSARRYYDDPDRDAGGSTSVEKRPPPTATPADVTTKKDAAPKPPEVDNRAVSVLHGIGDTILGGLFGIFGGIAKTASDVAHGSFRALVRPFEAVASVAIFTFAKLTSTLLTSVGLEPKGRKLSDDERAMLRREFGPGLDLEAIRIKEGANVLSAGAGARTVGNTIYINSTDSPAKLTLIAHEAVHAWQYQHGGTLYIAGSLEVQGAAGLAGGRNGAYEYAEPIAKGREFRDLNPEQQANLMEDAAKLGMFASDEAAKSVRVIVKGVDYTDAVRAAQAKLRAGEGAP